MMSRAVLEAENIEKVLGHGATRVQALKGVALTLAEGQFTVLMGPSGSGKSTLLSILGCILTQTKGSVRIAGRSTAHLNGEQLADLRRQHIGFVFQSYNLFPGLSALENVRIGFAIRRPGGRDGAGVAKRALESVGLGHRIQCLPSQLSGGEQQRVAIARAIAGGPTIILADEPTAALDSESGCNVMRQLRCLATEDRRSVLAVSHDARALKFADRIITMEDGRILTDTTEAAVTRSLSTASKAYMHA